MNSLTSFNATKRASIFVVALILFFNSCQQHYTGVPELKQRNVTLINPLEEWDQVKMRFANLQRNIQKNPHDAESKVQLADLYMNEARVTGDEDYYTAATQHVLNDVLKNDLEEIKDNAKRENIKFQALTMKAYTLASLHQFSDALETGKQAIAINPYNSLIYGVMVDANVELGNYDEAVRMCEKMMDIRPDLRSYSRASYLREIHGDIPGAIEVMKLAVSAGAPGQEQTAWTRVTLGKLYEKTGDFSNAEAQYGLALMERADYPYALAGMARVSMKNGDSKNAENLLNKAINIFPSVSFYEELALLYKQTGEKEKEQAAIAKAMDQTHQHHHHGSNVGLENAYLYLRLKADYDSALVSMQQEIKMRPENIEVNKVVAWAYLGKGDLEKAGTYIQKAMKTNSQDAETLCVAEVLKEMENDNQPTELRRSLILSKLNACHDGQRNVAQL